VRTTQVTTAVMTIASANYMPYVITLMQSLRDTNPAYRRFLFLADKNLDLNPEWEGLFEVVEADALPISGFADMVLRYDIMEFNTAIKPYAMQWLMQNTEVDRVIYLDPDIFVYRPLSAVDSLFDSGASMILTPHLTSPLEDGRNPNDYNMLQAGVFNLGFAAIRREAEALDFVDWWARRLATGCYADMPSNLFTDQRWCDLAPCYVENLAILRDPGYNVAYWNLAQRPLKKERRGHYTFKGSPLTFFHFSGLSSSRPKEISKHQNRFSWNDIPGLQSIFENYRKYLTVNGWNEASQNYYYGSIDGITITPIIRRLYRNLFPDVRMDATLSANFVKRLCTTPVRQVNANGVDGENVQLSALMLQIYKERPDLAAAFDLTYFQGAQNFVEWFQASAHREYGVSPNLGSFDSIDEPRDADLLRKQVALAFLPNAGRSALYRQWRRFRKWIIDSI
jgi:hypothetical protein